MPCAAQTPVRTWTPVIDSVGRVPRITSPGYTMWRDSTTGWKMTFERSITLEGAKPGQFDRAWQALLLPDRRMLVSHRNPAGIELYDTAGKVERTIGNDGSGPDDFASASSMLMYHDTLIVGDGIRGRVLFYTLDGVLHRSFFVDVHGEPLALAIDGRGRLRVQQRRGSGEGTRLGWLYFTLQGKRVDSLDAPFVDRPRGIATPSAPGRVTVLQLPYQPLNGFTFRQDGPLVYGFGDAYQFAITNTGRDTVRLFARSGFTPLALPASFADSTAKEMNEGRPPGTREIVASDFPAVFPIWNEIATDELGYLWVSRGFWIRRTHAFDVFAPDGRYLGYVVSRFESLRTASWSNGRVAITTYDRNRMPVVRIFRIDRPDDRLPVEPIGRPATFTWGDTKNVCALYAALLPSVTSDQATSIVMADSNSMGTTTFAFHAWSSMGAPKVDSLNLWNDSTVRRMNAANFPRAELPACLTAAPKVTTESWATLIAHFSDREKGWEQFRAAHPGAAGFHVFSRPLWLTPTQDEAIVYVARAFDWLAGDGTLYYLRRRDGRWAIVERSTLWVS